MKRFAQILLAALLAISSATIAQVTTNPVVTGKFDPTAPGAIGGKTPGTGAFTTLTATTVNGNTITTGSGTITLGAGKTLTFSEGTFSPASHSFTVTGAETLTGRYSKVGLQVTIWIQHSAGTSLVGVQSTSYYDNLPYSPAHYTTCTHIIDDQTQVVGIGAVQSGTVRVYLGGNVNTTTRALLTTCTFQATS